MNTSKETAFAKAREYNVKVIGGIIQRDLAYLDCPFHVIEDLVAHGCTIEQKNIVPLNSLQKKPVKTERTEFGTRSLF